MLSDLMSCLALKMDVEDISWLLCPLGGISLVTLNYQGLLAVLGQRQLNLGNYLCLAN